MPHFGLVCPPGTSHVTGLTTIARELCRRGHRATVFNILDVEEMARTEGVGFHALGEKDHPRGSFQAFSEKLAALEGTAALRFGLRAALAEISMLLEEAPDAMRQAGVTALLVDQGQPAGSTIAARLGVPFVTICNAVPVDPDPLVPPSITSWRPPTSAAGRLRVRLAYRGLDLATRSLRARINEFRAGWGLPPLRSSYETFSPILEIAQQTRDFDFPRASPPPQLEYVGLIHRQGFAQVPFPFDRLNGKPVIYTTLGTVRTDIKGFFSKLAAACSLLPVQLVITLGGSGRLPDYVNLPGAPIVVSHAPQLAVLSRASLTVCHAGNNTVLESLAAAVPVLAVPMNNDQYGVAARVVHSGAGDRIHVKELSEERLHETIGRLIQDKRYANRAKALQASIANAGGEVRAADLIEQKLGRA